jgi:hypothetical protein
MAEPRKTFWETFLQSGGVGVTAISVFGVVMAGYFTFVSGGQTNAADVQKAEIEARTRQVEIASEQHTAICDRFYAFVGDESPNRQFGAEATAAIDAMVVQNSQACAISEPAMDDGLSGDSSAGAPEIAPGAGND